MIDSDLETTKQIETTQSMDPRVPKKCGVLWFSKFVRVTSSFQNSATFFSAALEEVWKSLVSIWTGGGKKMLEQFTSGSQIVEGSLVLDTWV